MGKFFNKYILPPVMKFVNTKPMLSLRDGMVLSLPFIMIGSVFLLLASFPLPAVANWMNENGLTQFWSQAYNCTFGIGSVFSVIGIAYTWAKKDRSNSSWYYFICWFFDYYESNHGSYAGNKDCYFC
jgi:PTS system cellobiose-specific IIC component